MFSPLLIILSQSSHPWIFRPTVSPSFLTCARTLQISPLLSFLRVRPLRSLPPPFSSRCSLHSVRIFLPISSLFMPPPNPNPISLLDLASETLDYFPLPLRKPHFYSFFLSLAFVSLVQHQPRPLPPISDLLRAVDENWPAPPNLFNFSHLEETIAAEGAEDVFLGPPGSTFTELIEDARMPSLSYDAFRSPYVPNLPIQAEDATSSSFPLVDFSSWSGSTHAMNDSEAGTTLSLPLPSSRLHEEYPTTEPSFPGLIPLDTWGFDWARRERRERVDPEPYGDECSMRCPRCGWSAPTPPVDPLMSWLYD